MVLLSITWWALRSKVPQGCEGYGLRFQKRSTRLRPGSAKAREQVLLDTVIRPHRKENRR